ncbi:MAG: DNA repair protein RadA, partial [Ignavibacteriaceae bacterium]
MSKTKIKYICSNCGYESLRWLGKCPECDSWNSFTEEIVETSKKSRRDGQGLINNVSISTIKDTSATEEDSIKTEINEFDRVLGGGLMPGSVILLGGDPGIGK